MDAGLMTTALAWPLVAAGIGGGLGLAGTLSAARVARWSHLLGLRDAPVLRWWYPGLFALVLAGLSAAVSLSGSSVAARAFVLGALWGHTAMDLANNSRAAAALRAVAETGPTLGAWLRLPLKARLRLTLSATPAVLTMLAVAALLVSDPGLYGLLAGALVYLAWQRLAAGRALDQAFHELAEQTTPPAEEES